MATAAKAQPALSAQQHSANFTAKARTIALVIVALGFVMDLLDSTVVNIAIPSIRTNLMASYSAIQWVVAGYTLMFALLLVTGGRLGDVVGYKKVFMFGMAGFTIASLLSGLAQNPGMLIASRLLQGGTAAFMVPQVFSMMQVMYKPEERGAINGLFGALGGLSASIGPLIGGLLIKANVFNLDWRPIFLINVPIGLFGLVMAAKYLPEGKSPHPLKLDMIGTGLIVIAMTLLIFPLIQGRELGWPLWSYIMMLVSIPTFLVFAWWQKKKDKLDGSPLILPSLFKQRSFTVGLGVNLLFEMAFLGFLLTFSLLLQIGLGFSAIHAALSGLGVAVGIAFTMALLGEKLIPKLGRKALAIGCAIMAVGLLLTTITFDRYGLGLHSWQLIVPLLITGNGIGFVFGSLFAAVLNGVDPKNAGSASGTMSAVQQIGGSVGIALIGVIFFGQLSHAALSSVQSVQPQLASALSSQHLPAAEQSAIIKGVERCFVDRSKEKDSSVVPASCKNQPASSVQLSKTIQSTALQANAQNFQNAFKWSTYFAITLLAITFSFSFLLPEKFKTDAYAAAL